MSAPKCPDCDGKGYRIAEDGGAGTLVRCGWRHFIAEDDPPAPEPTAPATPAPAGMCAACWEAREQWVAAGSPEPGPRLCPECSTRAAEAGKLRAALAARPALLAAAGVPRRYYAVEFIPPATWPADARAPDLTVDKWEGDPWSVLLHGPTGSGKSYLAAELLWRAFVRAAERRLERLTGPRCAECSDSGWRLSPGLWARPSEAADRMQRCDCAKVAKPRRGVFIRASQVAGVLYSKDPAALARWSELIDAPLLVVDDVGRGHDGGAWAAVGELISARYDAMAPTVATSNQGLRELAEAGDSAIADRLTAGIVAAVAGESQRTLRPPPAPAPAPTGKAGRLLRLRPGSGR